MIVKPITPASFASNCYVVTSGGHSLIVDPSASTEAMLDALKASGTDCVGIVLTHGHFDHILSLDVLRDALPDVPVYIHGADAELLGNGEKNAFSLFFGQDRSWRPATHLLANGDAIALGSEQLRVLSTPGHTAGSICLLGDGLLLTGDTLFDGSFGRYDLYGGSLSALRASLERLSSLDPTLTIYPGHGGTATLGAALATTGLI